MVERFHRQLKASIKAQGNSSVWTEALPLVLLGIRTSFKSDINCSAAELAYGTSFRLPGEFFSSSGNITQERAENCVQRLRLVMIDLQPTCPRTPSTRHTFVSRDLDKTTHVFLRHDGVKKPLQSPYDGPYLILRRDKNMTLDVNGREVVV